MGAEREVPLPPSCIAPRAGTVQRQADRLWLSRWVGMHARYLLHYLGPLELLVLLELEQLVLLLDVRLCTPHRNDRVSATQFRPATPQ